MNDEFDDATRIGSIGHPADDGAAPSLPAWLAAQNDADDEGTILSARTSSTHASSTHASSTHASSTHASSTHASSTHARFVRERQATIPQNMTALQNMTTAAQLNMTVTQPSTTATPPDMPAATPNTTATPPDMPTMRPADSPTMMAGPNDDIAWFHNAFTKLVGNISQVVVGKEKPIRQCATALVVGGHVLLEDNPGTGKTQLARGLANSIDTSFKRIQFTPDLLPSDVVGVTYYDQKHDGFEYREGPIFASIVLADEINRASPKTQSALLEVMEEQKVTVDGETHPVAEPFMVIATQNPIEQLGTYRLPEAQMDRFLMKTTIGYPSHEVSVSILKQVNVTDRAATVRPVLAAADVLRMRKIGENVHMDDAIIEYIVRLVEHTRHDERISIGSSMRGALALARCARVWAAADNRGYVVPDDVKELAESVLVHRIMLTPEATFSGATPQQVIRHMLGQVPAPMAGARA